MFLTPFKISELPLTSAVESVMLNQTFPWEERGGILHLSPCVGEDNHHNKRYHPTLQDLPLVSVKDGPFCLVGIATTPKKFTFYPSGVKTWPQQSPVTPLQLF